MKRIFTLLCCCFLLIIGSNLNAQDGALDCTTATDISANITGTCNTITNTIAFPAGGTLEDPCGLGSAPTESIWYSFVAPANGVVDVSNTNDGATPDTQVSFHDGSAGACGALVCGPFDDDAGAGFTSQIIGAPVVAGTTYYIQWLDGWAGAPAAWELQFASDPAAAVTGAPTTTDATLSYDAACANMTYEYGLTGFAQGTGTPGTTTGGSVTIPGLTAATTYDVCFFCDALGSGETAGTAVACDFTTSDAGAGSESPSVQCLTFTTSANCPTPTATAATGATDDVIDVTSTSNGGSGLFDIEIGAPGFAPGTGAEIAQIAGTFGPVDSFTGLPCSNTFDVYVRDNCVGPPAEVSLWFGPIAVSTLPCPGEDCSDPFGVTLTGTCTTITEVGLSGNGASALTSTGCWADGLANAARWYSFTAPTNGIVDIQSLATDTRVSLYDGDCAALNCLANDDDGGVGTQSATTPTAVTAGTTYLIEWDDRWGAAGFDWQIQFVQDGAPVLGLPNQMDVNIAYDAACTNFIYEYGISPMVPGAGTQATADGSGSIDITGLTPATTYDVCFFCDSFGEGYPPVACDLTGNTVVGTTVPTCVTFTTTADCPTPSATVANGTGLEDVDVTMTSNGGAGLFDIEIGLAGFTPGTGTEVATILGSFNTLESFTAADGLLCGTTYDVYVRDNCPGPPAAVSLWFPDPLTGPALSITTGSCPGTACDNPIPITITADCNSYTNTLVFPTGSGAGLEDACGIGTTVNEAIWFEFVAPANGILDVSSTNDAALPDTDLAVVSGACGAVVCEGFDDDGGAGFTSQAVGITVVGGQTYFVQWGDQWGGAPNSFEINFVADVAPPAPGTVGSDTADITYDDTCPNTTYEYGLAGFAQGAGDGSGVAAGGTVNLTGLTGGTLYDICFYCDILGTGATAVDVVTCDFTSSDAGADSETQALTCIQFTTATSCPSPTGVTCGAGAIDGDVDVTWANGGGDGTYDIEWGPVGFVPGSGTELGSVLGTTNLAETLAVGCGLAIDIYVRDNCAAEPSSWSGPCTFTTCTPVCDMCPGAINIPVEMGSCTTLTVCDNEFATDSNLDPGIPAATCPSYNLGDSGDIWFSLTVPASGNVTISGGPSPDCCSFLWYEVYTGADCGSLTSLVCSATTGNDPSLFETFLTGQTPGSTIWVRAWDSFNDSGTGTFEFNMCAYEPTPVVEETCADGPFTFCYPNGVTDFAFQVICPDTAGDLASVTFCTGDLEVGFDSMSIFSAPSGTADPIGTGTAVATAVDGDQTGITYTSITPGECLYFFVTSDVATSCADGGVTSSLEFRCDACPACASTMSTPTYAPEICSGDVFDIVFDDCQVNGAQNAFGLVFDTDPTTVPADLYAEWAAAVNGTSVDWVFLGNTANCGQGGFFGLAFLNNGCDGLALTPYIVPIDGVTFGVDVNCPIEQLPDFTLEADPLPPIIANNGDCTYTITGNCPQDILTFNSASGPNATITGDGTNVITYAPGMADPQIDITVTASNGIPGCPTLDATATIAATPVATITCPTAPLNPTDAPIDITATPASDLLGSIDVTIVGDDVSGADVVINILDVNGVIVFTAPIGSFPSLTTTTINSGLLPQSGAPYTVDLFDLTGDGLQSLTCGTGTVDGSIEILDGTTGTSLLGPSPSLGDGTCGAGGVATTENFGPVTPVFTTPGTATTGVFSGPGVNIDDATDIGGSAGIDNDGQTTFDPAAAGAGVHTITYTFTDINGCVGTATCDIEVTGTCSVNAGTDATIDFCSAGVAADITPADGDAGGTFTPALASGTGTFDPAVDAAGVYTYTVVDPTDPTCMDTADVTVTITMAPTCNTDCTMGDLEILDVTTCSCVVDVVTVSGCTDMAACNFDMAANCDDGSCNLPDGCTDPTACNFDATALCDNGTCDFGNTACADPCAPVMGCTDPTACNFDAAACIDDGSCSAPPCNPGCTDPCASNFDPTADSDDGSCNPVDMTCNTDCTMGDLEIYDTATCSCVVDVVTVLGCTDMTACNFDAAANCDDGSCDLPNGCTDPAFCEFDPNATCGDPAACITSNADPGTCNTDCTLGDTEVWDPVSCSCVVDVVTVSGCTDPTAANFDAAANCDDGSCLSIVFQIDGGNAGGPFMSDDPCACNNDESAPNAGDGTFSELVLVTGPPGLNVIASGMSSGLIGVTLPAPFVETSPGNYELTFNHLNLVGFTVTVGVEDPANPGSFIPALDANGNQVVQSNVCAYPVLTSTLPTMICNNAGPQDLDLFISEDNGDPPGTTSYTIDGAAAGNMLDPSAFAIGQTLTIVATFTSSDDGNGGSSPDGTEPAHPGMCDQTFTASVTIQDCSSCPTTTTVDCPEELCDGDVPTMFAVVVDDPLGTGISSGWFEDPAGTIPLGPVSNQGCASSTGATFFVVSCDSDGDGVGDTQVVLLTHNFDIYPADFTATVTNTTDCSAPSVSIAAADGTECGTSSGTAAAAPVCPATSTSETSAYSFNFFDGTSCEQNFSGLMTSDCSGTCPCPVVIGTDTSEDACGSSSANVPADAAIIDDTSLGTVVWSPDPTTVVPSGCALYTVVFTSTIICNNDCSMNVAGPTHTLNVYPDPADFQGAVAVAGTCGTSPSLDLSAVTCLPEITGPTATTPTVDGCDTNADTSDDSSDGAFDFALAQPASTVCPVGTAYSETLSTTDTACTDMCPGVVDFCELVIACIDVSECDGTSGAGIYDITVTLVYNVTSGNSIDVSVDGGASTQSLTPTQGALTTATMTFTGLSADAASHTVDAIVVDPSGICTSSAGQASYTAPADCAACNVPNAGTVTGP